MVFNSFSFLIFFPAVLLLYRVLPKRARWVMLLAASYWFYMSWQPELIWLILFTTAVSYLCGLGIEKARGKKIRKLLLAVALLSSLSVLFFFKYFNFVCGSALSLLRIFGLELPDFSLNLILPVGISFYTFRTLSYVIDVYREKMPAERHFGYYALYVAFFPQLVAGPIERPENLIPQLKEDHPFSAADSAEGIKLMAVGFFKKVAVADQLSKYVEAVYNGVNSAGSETVNGFTVILATLLFAVQIYCDFSGYTDIAIGCARVMGIRLMQNFNAPYSALSIRDFWRRWHISLTSWFTDYIYIPLGGSRRGRVRQYANIFIVFLVSGIWHGAAWTYIIWGIMHGIYQIVGHITEPWRESLRVRLRIGDNPAYLGLRRFATFGLVTFAWVAFRANSPADMLALYRTLFTGWRGIDIFGSLSSLGLGVTEIITAALSVFVAVMLDRQIALKPRESAQLKLTPGRAVAYIALVWAISSAWIILLSSGGPGSFIYFQF